MGVLQCVAVCCSILQSVVVLMGVLQCVAVCYRFDGCVAVCCSVLQIVVGLMGVLQCVVVCCSVLQCDVNSHICFQMCGSHGATARIAGHLL